MIYLSYQNINTLVQSIGQPVNISYNFNTGFYTYVNSYSYVHYKTDEVMHVFFLFTHTHIRKSTERLVHTVRAQSSPWTRG